jgi:hypothetical protein
VTTAFLGPKEEGLAIVNFLNKLIVSCKEAVRIKMRAKQQHVCKEMNQYTNNTNRNWFLSFSIE